MKKVDTQSRVVLHKVKKQWVALLSTSAALMAIVGLGAQPVAVHAATVDGAKTTEVAKTLDETKAEATKTVKALENSSFDEKQQAVTDITKAETADDVASIVKHAKEVDAKTLDTTKENTTKAVTELAGLTPEQKTEATTKIKAATNVAGVNAVMNDLLKLPSVTLEKAKTNAANIIDKLAYLSLDEKAELTTQAKAGKNVVEVAGIVGKAIAKDVATHVQLNDSKEDAKKIVSNLKNLSDAEKEEFTKQVDGAESIKRIAGFVRDAIAQDQVDKTLNVVKGNAKEIIDSMVGLTQVQKDDFDKQTDLAKTEKDVNKLLNKALDSVSDDAPLKDFKANAKEVVDSLEALTDKDKAGYDERIDAAEKTDAVNVIVNEALDHAESGISLNGFKINARTVVSGLEGLDKKEIASFIKGIDKAVSQADVNKVVNDALDKAASNLGLVEFKKNATELINTLEGLTDEQKAEFVKTIEEATTTDDVNKVVNDALDEADANIKLGEFKANAKEVVNSLEGLSADEKAKAVKAIDKAKTTDAANKVVNEAMDLAKANLKLDAVKKEAIEKINGLKGLTDAQKATYTEAINNAKSADEVNKIVERATEKSEKALAGKTETPEVTKPGKKANKPAKKAEAKPAQGQQAQNNGQTPQTGEKNTVAYALTGMALLGVALGSAVYMKRKHA